MSTWDIVKIFLILGAMLGIMYAMLFVVKKYFYSFDKKGSVANKINILSTQTILPKKYVSVIKFNDKVYLLGIADQSINVIDKFESITEFENEDTSANQINKPNFLQLLKQNMGMQ